MSKIDKKVTHKSIKKEIEYDSFGTGRVKSIHSNYDELILESYSLK